MASHNMKRQGGRQRRGRGEYEMKRETKATKAGLLQGRRQSERKKCDAKGCTEIRCSFPCPKHSKRERLSGGERANDLALNERKEMKRMCALSPVSQVIKKPAACSMLSVLIPLNKQCQLSCMQLASQQH